jgi:hypothetical protein
MSERILVVIAGLLAALVLGLAFFWMPEMPERPLPKAQLLRVVISPWSLPVARFPEGLPGQAGAGLFWLHLLP